MSAMPGPKRAVSIRIDADVVAFFKAQGPGYQTRMNAVLRSFMDSEIRGAASDLLNTASDP